MLKRKHYKDLTIIKKIYDVKHSEIWQPSDFLITSEFIRNDSFPELQLSGVNCGILIGHKGIIQSLFG